MLLTCMGQNLSISKCYFNVDITHLKGLIFAVLWSRWSVPSWRSYQLARVGIITTMLFPGITVLRNWVRNTVWQLSLLICVHILVWRTISRLLRIRWSNIDLSKRAMERTRYLEKRNFTKQGAAHCHREDRTQLRSSTRVILYYNTGRLRITINFKYFLF